MSRTVSSRFEEAAGVKEKFTHCCCCNGFVPYGHFDGPLPQRTRELPLFEMMDCTILSGFVQLTFHELASN